MESNHVIPRYQRGAFPVWLTPLVQWSRECSNLPLPGFNRPLRRQSFRTLLRCCGVAMEPVAGIEPAASRVRAERPYLQDLAGKW